MRSLYTLLAVTLVLATGCATSNVAYKTLAGVQKSVDAAMLVYVTEVKEGWATPSDTSDDVPVEFQSKVEATYDDYNEAYELAVKAARQDFSSAAPEKVLSLLGDLLLLLEDLEQ